MAEFDSFRTARWIRTLNLVLQAVLFLTFFLGLNYLARNHAQAWRKDLTQNRRYSLSPETLSWVRQLPQPVSIAVTVTDETDCPADVRGLLKEYENATEAGTSGKITVSYVDPYQNRREAERLGVEQAGALVFMCGDKRRVRTFDELYRIKDKQREAFIGEQTITESLLDVSRPTRERIFFLIGHGELRPDDPDPVRGLSAIRDELRIRNFDVDMLELPVARKIPIDPNAPPPLLIAVAPQSRYTAAEQEALRRFLGESAGRLILFLAPGAPVTSLGLDDLLLDWGILVDDDRIWDTGTDNMSEDEDLFIRFFHPTHPVCQGVLNNRDALRLSSARSVRPDPGRSLGSGLSVTPLAVTSTTAWGERDYRSRTAPHFDPGIDIRPLPGMEPKDQLGIVVASERIGVRDNLPLSVRGGRLVVFGTGDLIANSRIPIAGNERIFLGAVNWAVDRDRQLNVPARPIERFELALSAGELLKLRYALLFALPGTAAVLGLIVYWTRRS